MIEIKNVTKNFGDFTAIDGLSFTVENSSIYGIIGYNGAGKTTLLKSAAGIYRTDSGKVLLDGENAYDNAEIRQKLFYVPDDMYFIPNATAESMGNFYAGMYQGFDKALLLRILEAFKLDKDARLRSFSKGMKRQAEIAFALASRPKFMLLDEVFDGLDPQKREVCKRLFLEYIAESDCSVLISSHNLAELADLCDHVGLINGKKLTMDCCVDDISAENKRYRVILRENADADAFSSLPVKHLKAEGRIASFVVNGADALQQVETALAAMPVVSADAISMTLEEVFLNEMEDTSYEIESIFS